MGLIRSRFIKADQKLPPDNLLALDIGSVLAETSNLTTDQQGRGSSYSGRAAIPVSYFDRGGL